MEQKPLELILARNFLTSLNTPAFLTGGHGELLFYNEAAGALLGMTFEQAGRMTAAEWGESFGPFDEDGKVIPYDQLPTTRALRKGRPAHADHRIRSVRGAEHEIEVSALPIMAEGGQEGAMVFFWPRADDGEVG
jgi:PAS domain-containing protein